MDETKKEPMQSTVPTKIKIPEIQLEFLVQNNQASKLFLNCRTVIDNIRYHTLNEYYKPLTPPPKC